MRLDALLAQMDASFQMLLPFAGESEIDNMKSIFLDVDPMFLMLTMVVSMVHLMFDILAFKVPVLHTCNCLAIVLTCHFVLLCVW